METVVAKELKDYDYFELEDELERRGYFVTDYNPVDMGCEECENRIESSPPDETLEQIHYLLVGGKTDEAVQKVRDLIYDQIGRIS
jgi:hypothetical protein